MPPEEIARVVAAMQKLEPLDIPEDVGADLDDWERKINQRGIEHRDPSMEEVFPEKRPYKNPYDDTNIRLPALRQEEAKSMGGGT